MSKQFLLDTCICAYWLRDKYDVKHKINAADIQNCYISEVTIAELKFGAIYGKLKGGPKYKDQKLNEFFANIHVLPTFPVYDLFAEEKARLMLAGTPSYDDFDLLIGCTAVFNNMTLVTQNVRDFKNIQNISIENWIE